MRKFIGLYFTTSKLPNSESLRKIPPNRMLEAIELFLQGNDDKILEILLQILMGNKTLKKTKKGEKSSDIDFVKEIIHVDQLSKLNALRKLHATNMLRSRLVMFSAFKQYVPKKESFDNMVEIKANQKSMYKFYRKFSHVGRVCYNLGIGGSLDQLYGQKILLESCFEITMTLPEDRLRKTISLLMYGDVKEDPSMRLITSRPVVKHSAISQLVDRDGVGAEAKVVMPGGTTPVGTARWTLGGGGGGSVGDFSFERDFRADKLEDNPLETLDSSNKF